MSSSKLLSILKTNGDLQPIALGESLRRLTARAMCMQKRRLSLTFFRPVQHGVPTKSGPKLITHRIQLALQENPDWVVIKSDVKNAFNSISRRSMLDQLSTAFPDLANHANRMYEESSSLLFMQGSSPIVISSEEGVHQGDSLGRALFAITIQPVLLNLEKDHLQIHVLAYLDDVFLLGNATDVLCAFHNLKRAFSSISLEITSHKCEIFCSSSTVAINESAGIPVNYQGSLFLGTPIGSSSFAESLCSTIAQSGNTLCDQLTKLGDIQSAMLLLRHCHVPKLDYLAQTGFPGQLTQAAKIHDTQMHNTFSNLLGYVRLDDSMWQQASLPIRLGGFGMTLLTSVSQHAFVASRAHAIIELSF